MCYDGAAVVGVTTPIGVGAVTVGTSAGNFPGPVSSAIPNYFLGYN